MNSGTGKGGVLARKKAEAEARIKAILEDKARAKAIVEGKARANDDVKDRAVVQAKARDSAEIEAMAKAAVEAEAKARAEAEARIVACEKAEPEARAEAELIFIAISEFQALTTPLYYLATDCLRLSMHFFHPIQQCAQQVYHTAIPLSPTSSCLQKYFLQNVLDNQLSLVTTFSGAPDVWGLLLRTIDIRPRKLTYIATSVQGIIAACGDVVNIYDPVTFVLHQSLSTPEAVTKIQYSPDGTILFFAHSFSVTMWDVQTGGLIHTFTVESEISDIAASTTGNYIACTSEDSVTFWNIHTRMSKSKYLGESIVTICWLPPLKIAVATKHRLCVYNVASNKDLRPIHIPSQVWGMVYLANKGELLVGASQLRREVGQDTLEILRYKAGSLSFPGPRSLVYRGQLSQPVLAGEEIVCIVEPTGVQSFNITSYESTNNPPLLDAAISVAVSLNRNIVTQTKDAIQIFSLDVLTSGETKTRDTVHTSHIYPLGENYIICVLPTRCLTLLESETLQELHPRDDTSPFRSLFKDQSPSVCPPFNHGPAAEFGVPIVIEAWQSGTPLPKWTESTNKDGPLSGLSPKHTHIVTVYGSPRRELRVKDAKDGTVLANLPLDINLTAGEVYDLTFDSETRFYLKIDGPEHHVQIPYDITASLSGTYSHTITEGEPVALLEPRETPPYTLDENFEWVLDARSRKICWIPPGNVRRGSGGHFWAGLSLVMVGDDGVMRKLSFKEPDC